MHEAAEFDLLTGPLQGRHLLEASAGTGKTYTIAGLFLRLLLEQKIPVDQILVVTFTEAATNELKERIHTTLQNARGAFAGERCDDPFLKAYVKGYKARAEAIDELQSALKDFDEAAVFTIHKFCNRVLQENAFESGSLFEPELITEQTALLRQVVQDFWRQNLYHASGMFLRYTLSAIAPDKLVRLVQDTSGMSYIDIVPRPAPSDCAPLETRFQQSYETIRRLWQQHSEQISFLLRNAKGLHKSWYYRRSIPAWIQAMDAYLSSEQANPVVFKEFSKFARSTIERGTTKGHQPIRHAFFDACESHQSNLTALLACYDEKLKTLKAAIFDYVRDELPRRKQEQNVLYFDDLLLNLHAALNKGKDTLAKAVATRFQAALIDEFQDTDPIQYEIFQKIFAGSERPLFLIGDPKQAIYGFRGADIFAYMRAKSETRQENRHTLSTNYRATPELISATNTTFSNAREPFVFPEIPFKTASPSPSTDERPRLMVPDEPEHPLRMWYVDASKHNPKRKSMPRQDACALIVDSVAGEVARLLALGRQGKAVLGDRPLAERDIAVLVRYNWQAQSFQTALRRLQVHSVLYSSASLFDSSEAQEWARILTAIADPRRQSLLKAALATEMLGVDGNALYRYSNDDPEFEACFDRFMDYHTIWQEHGFMRMFNALVQGEQVAPRLMQYNDGERRMTNLLHLAEVLNQAASERKLGMSGLLKWFAEQITMPSAPAEEHQLRLESDENAVKLVTMHMSKGLQYPVVFCPFTWHGSMLWRANILKFHQDDEARTFTLDLGSEDRARHKSLAEKETLAENLRLLYVAVTRAQHRCYLIWGRFSEGPSSAPAYLFHPPDFLDPENLVHTLHEQVKSLNDAQLKADLEKLATAAQGNVLVRELPQEQARQVRRETPAEAHLQARIFEQRVDPGERISSYSSLIARVPHGEEMADHDTFTHIRNVPDVPEPEASAYRHFRYFPRGAKTGTFVHDILQYMDFEHGSEPATSELVSKKLQTYGYASEWQPAVSDMLQRVRTVSLPGSEERFSLSDIGMRDRLNELEFYFPLRHLTPASLRAVFQNAATDLPHDLQTRIQSLTFTPLKGFMKGFIDLVFQHKGRFYIVDWKSNYLGADLENYTPEALSHTMVDSLYILQYHIYAVALEQYLRLRVPNYDYATHFGGVFYIFLRGVEPEQGSEFGIYRACPHADVLTNLSEVLLHSTNG